MLFPGYFSLHRVRFLILILHIRPFRTNFGSVFFALRSFMFKFVFWVRFFFRVFFSSLFSFSTRSFSSTTFLTGLFLLPAINYLVACTTLLQCTDINVSLLNAQAHSYCYFICIGNHRKRTLLTFFFFSFDFFFVFVCIFCCFVEFIQSDVVFIQRVSTRSDVQLYTFYEWHTIAMNRSRISLCQKKTLNKRMHCIRKPVNV